MRRYLIVYTAPARWPRRAARERLEYPARTAYSLRMDNNPATGPVPAGWLEILAESEAELAAGLTVDGDQLIRELYAAAEQLEAAQAEKKGRKSARRR